MLQLLQSLHIGSKGIMVSGRFTVRSGKVCEAGCREVWVGVIRCLVNSVGNSVTGVQLDGGQDGLTAGGSGGNSEWGGNWSSSGKWGSDWSSNWEASSVWVSSIGQGKTSVWETKRKSSGSWSSSFFISGSLAIERSSERSGVGDDWVSSDLGGDLSGLLNNRLDNGSMGNSSGSWEGSSSVGQGKTSSNWSSGSVGQGKTRGKGKTSVWETKRKSSNCWSSLLVSVTSLSLRSSGGGSFQGDSMGGLGLSDLWGVLDWLWGNSVKDWGNERFWVEGWGNKGCNLWGSWSNWEVGAGDLESVDGVGDIVDGLEQTVGVNVLVGAGGHSIGVSCLSTGQWTSGVSKRELSELILSMELGGRSGIVSPGVARHDCHLGRGGAYGGC